jgi:hypothetical protein
MNRPFRTPRNLLPIAALVALATTGCDTISSEDIERTASIDPVLVARSEGEGVTLVRATLYDEEARGLTYVELAGGDQLRAERADPVTGSRLERAMVASRFGARVTYEARFGDDRKDTEIRVALDRDASGRASAPESTVTLPSPFRLAWRSETWGVAANAPSEFSRSDNASWFIEWTPQGEDTFEAGDVLTYRVWGQCIETRSGVLDWRRGVDRLELSRGAMVGRLTEGGREWGCPIYVELTLTRQGVVDRAFGGGRFVAEQVRERTLHANP